MRRTDVALAGASAAFERQCEAAGHRLRRVAGRLVVEIEGQAQVDQVLRWALAAELQVLEVTPRHETLEDLFVREAIGTESPPG